LSQKFEIGFIFDETNGGFEPEIGSGQFNPVPKMCEYHIRVM
jgi:hypothetical protein